MAAVQYNVYIDWDATDWGATPDFSQPYDHISGEAGTDGINYILWKRGKQREEGNAPAALLEFRLTPGREIVEKYSPFTEGVLEGRIRPWLPVKVTATPEGGTPEPVYFGYIQRIHCDPHSGNPTVSIYCTDGTDLLARQVLTQDYEDKEICSDGDAVNKILTAAGWPPFRRDIDDKGGDDLLGYPATYAY